MNTTNKAVAGTRLSFSGFIGTTGAGLGTIEKVEQGYVTVKMDDGTTRQTLDIEIGSKRWTVLPAGVVA